MLSLVTNVPFATALGGYYTRGPLRMWGGGDILAALLGPAVITFAFIMDGQRRVARSRGVEVLGSCAFSATAALLGSAWVCRMAGLSTMGRLVMVPRTVTAPLAVGIAQMIGADVGIAASVVAITGLIGANIGAAVLSVAGVKDGVVRGLSIGSAAHGLGTAAVSEENDTFPFAALAMTLVGVFSTLLVAFGPFRTLLIRTAIGSVVGAKVK